MIVRRRIPIVLALCAGGLALMFTALSTSAAPLAVARAFPSGTAPCNTTLQACINGSAAGDQINIAANTYVTSFTLNKAVSLVGANQATTILRSLTGQRVITVTNAVTNGTQISNLTLQGGTLASGNGGVMWVQAGAQPALQNLTIQSGTVSAVGAIGGGIYAETSLALTNVTFLRNTSNEDGGGLRTTSNLSLNGGAFTSNVTTAGSGGALSVGGNLLLDGTTISGSLAFDSGGGLLVNGTSTIQNALIANNRSTGGSGGGLRAVGAAVINNTQFISNTSSNPGGGIRSSTAITLTNTNFLTNAAGTGVIDKRGGGLFANAGATIIGGLFQGNTAGSSGGGAQVEGPLSLSGATFRGNVAQTDGGGLHVITATIQNSAFVQNQALVGNGGGVHAVNYLVLSSSSFTANAVISGTAPNSTGSGGGVFSDGELISTLNVFVGNKAERLGGGMDADDLTSFLDEFHGNLTGAQGSGGGLFVAGVFDLDNGRFFTNTANTGGGLGVNSSATGQIYNSLFARNIVTFTDGGVAMRLLSGTNVTVTHNTLVGTNAASRAAVHMQGTGDFSLRANIIANHARGFVQFGSAPTSTVSTADNLFSAVTTLYIGTIDGTASNISGTAVFIDPASDNYHISGSSAALDVAPYYGPSADFEGDARPIGCYADAGFDEFLYVEVPMLPCVYLPFVPKQ